MRDTAGFPPNLPRITSRLIEHPLTWKDLEWIRAASSLPLLLKGVLHPEDADRAVQVGAAGIMVSNHGGRNLDTAPATIDALPRIVDRVAGRIPVIVDGGIRRAAAVSGRSLNDLIVDAIRAALAPRTSRSRVLKLRTYKGRGLQHGVDLDNSAGLLDLMDQRLE